MRAILAVCHAHCLNYCEGRMAHCCVLGRAIDDLWHGQVQRKEVALGQGTKQTTTGLAMPAFLPSQPSYKVQTLNLSCEKMYSSCARMETRERPV